MPTRLPHPPCIVPLCAEPQALPSSLPSVLRWGTAQKFLRWEGECSPSSREHWRKDVSGFIRKRAEPLSGSSRYILSSTALLALLRLAKDNECSLSGKITKGKSLQSPAILASLMFYIGFLWKVLTISAVTAIGNCIFTSHLSENANLIL